MESTHSTWLRWLIRITILLSFCSLILLTRHHLVFHFSTAPRLYQAQFHSLYPWFEGYPTSLTNERKAWEVSKVTSFLLSSSSSSSVAAQVSRKMTREGHKERRQWLPSLPKKIRQLRRQRRRKRFDSTKAVDSAKGCKTFDTEYELSLFSMIPESIWTDKILPFLDRWSQNHLMETCRYISQQTFFDNEEQLKLLKWPTPGRICVSRQVLSLAFSPTDQHLFAAMAGRNQCLEYDKRFGPQNELLPEADA